MQNLKIYKKSPVMRNSAFFAVFSMIYIHVIESFVSGISTFDISSYEQFVYKHKALLITLFLFCMTLFSGRKYSKLFYLIFISQCIYVAFDQYFIALDKFVLILNFLFIILSYYFYLFMNSDLSEASSTPIVLNGDLYSGLTISEKVTIKGANEEILGKFINWDVGTCFIQTDSVINKLRGSAKLLWSFEGNSYSCEGEIVSEAVGIGVGIRMIESTNDEGMFGWPEFYDIIHSRGYSPTLTA